MPECNPWQGLGWNPIGSVNGAAVNAPIDSVRDSGFRLFFEIDFFVDIGQRKGAAN